MSDYWRELHATLLSLVPTGTPSARADDAVQVVLLAIWGRHRDSGAEPLRKPRAYLRKCVQRALVKLSKAEGPEVLLEELPEVGESAYQDEMVDAMRLARRASIAMSRHKVGLGILCGAEATPRDRKRLSRFRRDTREE